MHSIYCIVCRQFQHHSIRTLNFELCLLMQLPICNMLKHKHYALPFVQCNAAGIVQKILFFIFVNAVYFANCKHLTLLLFSQPTFFYDIIQKIQSLQSTRVEFNNTMPMNVRPMVRVNMQTVRSSNGRVARGHFADNSVENLK